MPFLATTDALGRSFVLEAPPRRIVSLVPSQTELLAGLGLGDEVVGLTRFCVHPEEWKTTRTIVGGTKNVNLERMATLQPDLILGNKEENVREQIEALSDLAPVYVTDVASVAEALAMIRAVGALVNRSTRAEALAAEIETGFATLDAAEPIRVAYLIWRAPYMTIGGDTFISDVLRRAGLVNVFADRTRYPEVSTADLIAASPEVLLLSSEPYPFAPEHLKALAAATGLPAVLVDGEVCSWYGSRMRLAPPYLSTLRTSLTARLAAS